MKVTFTLKDLPEEMLADVSAMEPGDAYAKLHKWATGDLRYCVKVKYGSGQFRDRVELNQLMRGNCRIAFRIEPRRGYKLATFDIEKGGR